MANTLYDFARQSFATAQLNWTSDSYKVSLINTTKYTFSVAHQFLSDITDPSAIVATSAALTGATAVGGACAANNPLFTAVTGATCAAAIIYKDTGAASTSTLIAYIDTATGLPIIPNGGDIILTFDTGVNKIFRL